ncbi:unnamed protein product, partial [Allacma fusca]
TFIKIKKALVEVVTSVALVEAVTSVDLVEVVTSVAHVEAVTSVAHVEGVTNAARVEDVHVVAATNAAASLALVVVRVARTRNVATSPGPESPAPAVQDGVINLSWGEKIICTSIPGAINAVGPHDTMIPSGTPDMGLLYSTRGIVTGSIPMNVVLSPAAPSAIPRVRIVAVLEQIAVEGGAFPCVHVHSPGDPDVSHPRSVAGVLRHRPAFQSDFVVVRTKYRAVAARLVVAALLVVVVLHVLVTIVIPVARADVMANAWQWLRWKLAQWLSTKADDLLQYTHLTSLNSLKSQTIAAYYSGVVGADCQYFVNCMSHTLGSIKYFDELPWRQDLVTNRNLEKTWSILQLPHQSTRAKHFPNRKFAPFT